MNSDEKTDRFLFSMAKELPESEDNNCPSEEMLASYLDGILPDEIRNEILFHLADCAKCSLILTEDYLSRTESNKKPLNMPAKLLRNIESILSEKLSIFKLIYKASQDVLEHISGAGEMTTLVPCPVRRENEAKTYEIDLAEQNIQISTDRQKDGLFEVWMKVDVDKFQKCEWQLWSGDRLIEHQPADSGDALFTDISEGTYNCILRIGGLETGKIQLTLVVEA